MNKIIHVHLTKEEIQPILPHILALSIKEETLALRRKIIYYCEGIALLHDNYKESWIGKPKHLGSIDIQMRWRDEVPKAYYKVTLIIDETEVERKGNENQIEPYRYGAVSGMRAEVSAKPTPGVLSDTDSI